MENAVFILKCVYRFSYIQTSCSEQRCIDYGSESSESSCGGLLQDSTGVCVTCRRETGIPPQTPSDWLMRYSAVRRRAGNGCLGDEWWCWWRPRSEVWLPWWWGEDGGGGGSRREGGTAEDLMGTMRVSMTSQSTCIIIS